MLRWSILLLALTGPLASAACPDALNFSFRALAEERQESLCENYAGKVVLVVNTASKCGYTDQYDGLEALYDRYGERGLVVLGFPSNDFEQEPDGEQAIKTFCRLTYSVQFPMFEKVSVQGESAHPFFRQLATEGGGYPQWNFYKYLLDRDGKVVAMFPSRTEPQDPKLISTIEGLL